MKPASVGDRVYWIWDGAEWNGVVKIVSPVSDPFRGSVVSYWVHPTGRLKWVRVNNDSILKIDRQ